MAVLCGAALAACGLPDGRNASEASPHQQPSDITPGVQISGYANVGVKRGF